MLDGIQCNSKYAKYFKDKRAWTFVNSEAKTQRK
jgi:hypothetical protein